MSDDGEIKRSLIDRKSLPDMFPTNSISGEFWENLGRVVATFGFLEAVLAKAIFSFTATRSYREDEIEAAYEKWLPKLERAFTDPLSKLADSYGKAVRENPDATIENISDLVDDIKALADYRNAFCHGYWRSPDSTGASVPFFINRKMQIFETPIDIELLKSIQLHVAGLACSVMDTVTHMGWQFPGGAGPGRPIMLKE